MTGFGKVRIGLAAATLLAAGLLAPPALAAPAADAGTARPAAAGDYWVAAGDQKTNQLIAFDPAVSDWNSAAAVKWSWHPTAALGFTSAQIAGFGEVSDLKLRDTPSGAQRFVVAASQGLAAIVSYPQGVRQWAQVIGGNLHSVELLPNGNLAVAASTGGWVRVYAASQGTATYAQYNLTDAHSTLWDPATHRLWVVGADPATGKPILTALAVTGSAAEPRLREDTGRRVTLPTAGGHDLSADPNDPHTLLLSTGSAVYTYDTATRTLATPAAGARGGVKSITREPSGQTVETTPTSRCALNTWCTDTVDFFGPNATRTRTNAAFYKARVWNPHYTAAGDEVHGPVGDRTRAPAGGWSSTTLVDANADLDGIAAAALPDGTLHVETLVPGSGVFDRTRSAAGVWSATTKIDSNGSVTAISAAALPDGTLHVQTLLPGSGVWDRTRSTAGAWAASVKIDENPTIGAVAAAALPNGTLHVETLVGGSGVWDRARAANGTWAASSQIDDSADIAALSAAGLPNGTLHVQTLVPGGGVYDRARAASGTWAASTQIDQNGSVTGLAAAALPDGTLHVQTVLPGSGVWDRLRGTSGAWGGSAEIDTDADVFAAYSAGLPDGNLHVGTEALPH